MLANNNIDRLPIITQNGKKCIYFSNQYQREYMFGPLHNTAFSMCMHLISIVLRRRADMQQSQRHKLFHFTTH